LCRCLAALSASLVMQKFKSLVGIFLRGFAMGCADVVPGVSGGTIALITHIYERVIGAITKIDLLALKLFFRGQFAEFWARIDGSFLLILFCGILTAIFTLANSIIWLLENQPVLVWAFFSGLILASAILPVDAVES
jgi:putative membrane protein